MEEKRKEEYITKDDVSLLVLIVDTNPISWGVRVLDQTNSYFDDDKNETADNALTFVAFLEHLLIFLNAFLMLHPQNKLAVIASHLCQSRYLHPPEQGYSDYDKNIKDNDYEVIKKRILSGLKSLSSETKKSLQSGTLNIEAGSSLSGSLSLALCYINRFSKEHPSIKPRILVIHNSEDVSAQYIPVMNCIFSAQKQTIPVDACVLSKLDSTFLQQAAHITNGVYLKPPKQEGLLQYLLSIFLADRFSRKYLALPQQSSVDYRASCFCHKNPIVMGYVCSVCLSIFCKFLPVCSTCGTKFPLPALPKLPTSLINK